MSRRILKNMFLNFFQNSHFQSILDNTQAILHSVSSYPVTWSFQNHSRTILSLLFPGTSDSLSY